MPNAARRLTQMHHAARPEAACGQAFRSTAEAWFWTVAALTARREGARRSGPASVKRPCEPDDILKSLDNLYRSGRIDLAHARILRIWGERGHAPDPTRGAERVEADLWQQALARLEWPLRVKGIVI